MKVALFARHFQEYTARLANALAPHCEVRLIVEAKTLNTQWPIDRIGLSPAVRISPYNFYTRQGGHFSIPKAVAELRAFRPDVVHLQEVPDNVTSTMALAARAFSKVVVTVHDPSPHGGGDSAVGAFTRTLRNAARRAAHMIVVHGERCRGEFLSISNRDPESVISEFHGPLMSPVAITPASGRTCLMFGRMYFYKGLDVLLDASDRLQQAGVAHRVVLAGRGPEMDRLGDRAKAMPQVEVLNAYIDADEAQRLFRDTAVVVLPYRDATQSGVVASAFGNGRTVIASAVGGIPDVVRDGENGLLVPPGDPDALASAIRRVLDDPALSARLNAGVVTSIQGDMAWGRIGERMAAHYRRLLE